MKTRLLILFAIGTIVIVLVIFVPRAWWVINEKPADLNYFGPIIISGAMIILTVFVFFRIRCKK